jgi:hypothetical protein
MSLVLLGNGLAFDFHGRCNFAVFRVKLFVQQAKFADVFHTGYLLVDLIYLIGNKLNAFFGTGQAGKGCVPHFHLSNK